MEDFNFVINSPAAPKHLSASSEDGGNVFRQFLIFWEFLGGFKKHDFFLDLIQNIWVFNVTLTNARMFGKNTIPFLCLCFFLNGGW